MQVGERKASPVIGPHIPAHVLTAMIKLAEELSGAHWRPLLEAVRDRGVIIFSVAQRAGPFRPPYSKQHPLIALIGDDTDVALGPDGFHKKSLRRLMGSASAGIIVASAPVVGVYETAAFIAGSFRQKVFIIETRPEQEIPWAQFSEDAAPHLSLLISTVYGGSA